MSELRSYEGVTLDKNKVIYEINEFSDIYGCINKDGDRILFSDLEIVKVCEVLNFNNIENFPEINIKKIMELNNIYIHELRYYKEDKLYYYYKCNIYKDDVETFLKGIKANKEKQLEYPLIKTLSLIKNNLLKCENYELFFPDIAKRIYNFCNDILIRNLDQKKLIKKYNTNDKKFYDNGSFEVYIFNMLKIIEYEKCSKYKIILIIILMSIISNHLTNSLILNNKILVKNIFEKLEMLVNNLNFIDWNNIEHLESQNNP